MTKKMNSAWLFDFGAALGLRECVFERGGAQMASSIA
jgi:hypothetical protein